MIAAVGSLLEAQLAEGALFQAGISCAVESFNPEGLWDGLFTTQKGWGRIRVAASDAERARQLVRHALTTTEPPPSDGRVSQRGPRRNSNDTRSESHGHLHQS